MCSLYVPTLLSSQCKDNDASCRKCLPCMTYTQSATTLEAWVVATTMPTARCQTGSGIALMTAKCGLLTRATLCPPQRMYSSIGVSMKLSKIQVCFFVALLSLVQPALHLELLCCLLMLVKETLGTGVCPFPQSMSVAFRHCLGDTKQCNHFCHLLHRQCSVCHSGC